MPDAGDLYAVLCSQHDKHVSLGGGVAPGNGFGCVSALPRLVSSGKRFGQQPQPGKAGITAQTCQKWLSVTWQPLTSAEVTAVGTRNLDGKGEADDEYEW